MMATPVISVIIAVHNSEEYVLTCLQSLDQALHADIQSGLVEAIIVNDGSTDKSLDIIEHYHAKNFTKKIFSVSYHNVGKVKKFAFNQCSGEYITILDSDDAFKKASLSWLLSIISNLNFDMLITPVEEVRGCLHPQEIKIENTEESINKNVAKELYLNHKIIEGHIAGKFIRRSLLNDEMFPEFVCYEDMVTIAHSIHNSKKILYSTTSFYQYRKRDDSLSDDKNGEKIHLIFNALDKIEKFFLDTPTHQYLFDALMIKSISDLISRQGISKIPSSVKKRIRKIKSINYILCPKVRFSRKKMYIALIVRMFS